MAFITTLFAAIRAANVTIIANDGISVIPKPDNGAKHIRAVLNHLGSFYRMNDQEISVSDNGIANVKAKYGKDELPCTIHCEFRLVVSRPLSAGDLIFVTQGPVTDNQPPATDVERNQCDGCCAGMQLDGHLHRNISGDVVMACQKHRYIRDSL